MQHAHIAYLSFCPIHEFDLKFAQIEVVFSSPAVLPSAKIVATPLGRVETSLESSREILMSGGRIHI
jgi:hypothetical protein